MRSLHPAVRVPLMNVQQVVQVEVQLVVIPGWIGCHTAVALERCRLLMALRSEARGEIVLLRTLIPMRHPKRHCQNTYKNCEEFPVHFASDIKKSSIYLTKARSKHNHNFDCSF